MRDFRWVFDTLDTDDDNRLDSTEIVSALSLLGKPASLENVESVFHELAQDGGNGLEFLEFLELMRVMRDGDACGTQVDAQPLEKKANLLDTRILRKVLEIFQLPKPYVMSLSLGDLVGTFCDYLGIQVTDNLHTTLGARTAPQLYEVARQKDRQMTSSEDFFTD